MAAVVFLPMGLFAVVKWFEDSYMKLPVLGPADHSIANFQAANQYGAITSLQDWEGKITVDNFFFTHCPTVCPKMVNSLKKVQERYAGDEGILINSFTVDPERDSVVQLEAYAQKLNINNNWQLLTGDKKEIYKLARKSFLVVATDGDGGPADFIHSELLVLVDKEKRIRGYYNGTDEKEVDHLLRDINRLKKEYKN